VREIRQTKKYYRAIRKNNEMTMKQTYKVSASQHVAYQITTEILEKIFGCDVWN
jgi:hypothetical protein